MTSASLSRLLHNARRERGREREYEHGGGRAATWSRVVPRLEEPLVAYAGCLLFGVVLYFLLPFQPQGGHLATGGGVLAAICGGLVRVGALRMAFAGLWFGLAFGVTHVHTQRLDTALLTGHAMPWVTIQGKIVKIDVRDDGPRLFVHHLEVLDSQRMSWLKGQGIQLRPQGENRDRRYAVGQLVQGRVQLFPIGPPPVPGSLDLQFRAYFDGVSAYGATRGPLSIVKTPDKFAFMPRVEHYRQQINIRINEALGVERGSVLAAMTVGFPRGIPDAVVDPLRQAGLAHLLAISGLHMSLVVGGVFFVIRLGLAGFQSQRAIFPALSWRLPVKKVAMLAALGVGLGYFFISGQAVPVQRAFIMAGIFGMAILVDRQGLSLRNLALAAMGVMLLAPWVIMGPSFQMSFAAVSALILVSRMLPRKRHVGLPASLLSYVLGVALTSALATLATAMLTLFHFGQVSLVSVLANVVAVPIAGFVVMPAALLALLAMPFGLDGPFWALAGVGLDGILAVANWASALPNSQIQVAGWPRAVPALFAVVMLFLLALKGRGKLLALVPFALIVAALVRFTPADLIITPSGGMATVQTTGNTAFASPMVDDFERGFLAEYFGIAPQAVTWREMVTVLSAHPQMTCSAQACRLDPRRGPEERHNEPQGSVFLSFTREAANRLCQSEAVQISLLYLPPHCQTQPGYDSYRLAREGSLAIWLSHSGEIKIQSDLDRRGLRPWTTKWQGKGR